MLGNYFNVSIVAYYVYWDTICSMKISRCLHPPGEMTQRKDIINLLHWYKNVFTHIKLLWISYSLLQLIYFYIIWGNILSPMKISKRSSFSKWNISLKEHNYRAGFGVWIAPCKSKILHPNKQTKDIRSFSNL